MSLTVIVLTDVPPSVRGHLSAWMLEVRAGVFVADLSDRVRAEVWRRVTAVKGKGAGVMIFPDPSKEQRFRVETNLPRWEACDHDGVVLMARPTHNAATRRGVRNVYRYGEDLMHALNLENRTEKT